MGSVFAPAHVIPDAALVMVVFLGMRMAPVPLCLTALTLGYVVGRQALAPGGLHETALTVCAIGVYQMSGSFTGGGAKNIGGLTAIYSEVYQCHLYLLIYFVRGDALFSSWATASLLPGAVATGLLAASSYHLFCWIDVALSSKKREGLLWD